MLNASHNSLLHIIVGLTAARLGDTLGWRKLRASSSQLIVCD
jgi:hypothetical protein